MMNYDNLTRPIVGIENRTAHEVFDIMVERICSCLLDKPEAGEDDIEEIATEVYRDGLSDGFRAGFIKVISEALNTERRRTVPTGWKLLPRVPTQEMIDAGKQWTKASYIYDAMFESAPTAPENAGLDGWPKNVSQSAQSVGNKAPISNAQLSRANHPTSSPAPIAGTRTISGEKLTGQPPFPYGTRNTGTPDAIALSATFSPTPADTDAAQSVQRLVDATKHLNPEVEIVALHDPEYGDVTDCGLTVGDFRAALT